MIIRTRHVRSGYKRPDRSIWRRSFHRWAFNLLFVVALFGRCRGIIAAEENQKSKIVRETIARSVLFIERSETEWISTKNCVSCHHTAFTIWSLSAAKRKGIHVDEVKLNEWIDWAAEWHNLLAPASRTDAKRDVTAHGQSDTLAQLLLGRAAVYTGAEQPQWVAQYANDLISGQQQDGSWSSGGQLPSQKRPKRETQEVSTNWCVLALTSSHVSEKSLSAHLDKARFWLGEQTVGQSTEWWATRAMLERKLGNADGAKHFQAELLKRQRPDGGWGWLCNDDSDALATGIALFALGQDKQAAIRPAIENARRFLEQTQSRDGSWPVRGTKENKKNNFEPTATFWGTCWAMIGLCETLDD